MSWIRVDDEFPDHPKVESLEDDAREWAEAVAMWLAVACQSSRNGTPGEISERKLRRATPLGRRTTRTAAALCRAGLWKKTTREVNGKPAVFYEFHDWGDYNHTSKELLAIKKKNAEKQRRHRERKAMGVTGDTSGNGEGDLARARDPIPTQPIPTQPEGESFQLTAQDPDPPKPRRFCMHEDWVPDPGIFPWAQMHVDVRLPAAITDRIVGVFRDWWIANKPRTARDAKGWRAALMGWLKRERENKPHLEQSFHLDDSDVVLWRKTPKGFDWHDGQGLAPREDYEEAS